MTSLSAGCGNPAAQAQSHEQPQVLSWELRQHLDVYGKSRVSKHGTRQGTQGVEAIRGTPWKTWHICPSGCVLGRCCEFDRGLLGTYVALAHAGQARPSEESRIQIQYNTATSTVCTRSIILFSYRPFHGHTFRISVQGHSESIL